MENTDKKQSDGYRKDDTPEQIEQCLSCTRPECVNCIGRSAKGARKPSAGKKSGFPKIEMTGRRFGLWTVLGPDLSISDQGCAFWVCRCEGCGTIKSLRGTMLRQGKSTGCRSCALRRRAQKEEAIK